MQILRWAALHYQETVQNDKTLTRALINVDESVSEADPDDALDVWQPFLSSFYTPATS